VSAPLDWDATTYDRVADPQERWAREVLARAGLHRADHVLDAGCGSGRVTELLLAQVPDGRVIAVDGSMRMVEQARERLPGAVRVECQDLLELALDEQVDVVFSTAVFHHIHDHQRLFERLRAVLRDGGRLVAQCGGLGNIDSFRRLSLEVAGRDPYAEFVGAMGSPWTYAGPEETEERLRRAGFSQARCWLEPKPTDIDDEHAEGFMRSVLLNYHLEKLPAELEDRFVEEVWDAVGRPLHVEYVRLNIEAM
jgi:trans-aconitate 2-methyltransferase